MDSLFLLQFACFIFMFINAFIVALSCLYVRWKNKRYERSRWMIAAAIHLFPCRNERILPIMNRCDDI